MSVAASTTFPLPSQLGLAALLGSGALLGGAYYFQYVEGLAPCDMCYWQRYPHMVAIAAGLMAVASFAWPRFAFVFTLTAIAALFVTGGIGVYHAGVEWNFWEGPSSCTGPAFDSTAPASGGVLGSLNKVHGPSCSVAALRVLGVSMAGWNVIASVILAAIAVIGLRKTA